MEGEGEPRQRSPLRLHKSAAECALTARPAGPLLGRAAVETFDQIHQARDIVGVRLFHDAVAKVEDMRATEPLAQNLQGLSLKDLSRRKE